MPSTKITPEEGIATFKRSKKYIGLKNLINGNTGMQFTCKEDFTKYSTVSGTHNVYFRFFPASPIAAYQNMENRDSKSYWDRAAMKPGRKFDEWRDLLNREIYDKDRIEWDPLTIMQTSKLPRGMRYMVDWRYIGGIPPIENGRMKSTSYRRFIRPIPQSQCNSVCWFHMIRQSYSYSRPTQLGENARIPELGHVPYCDGSMSNYGSIKNNDVCNAGLTQMKFYGFTRGGDCKSLNTVDIPTWEKFTDNESFGINSDGQLFQIPYITSKGGVENTIPTRTSMPNINNFTNDGGDNTIPTDDAENIDTVGGEPDKGGSFDNTTGSSSTVFHTDCFYWLPYSSMNLDEDFKQYVDEKYQIKDGSKQYEPYMCSYNSIQMCNNREKTRKKLGFPNIQPRVCKSSNGINPILLKYHVKSIPDASWNKLFKEKKVFGEVTFLNGGASYFGSTAGIPMFMSKNTDSFMTGEMCRTSPILYIMFMLDNYGPLGIHLGSLRCAKAKENPSKLVKTLGGTNNASWINHFDLLIDGSGDTLDRLSRDFADDLCPTHYDVNQYGLGSGHSVALVGYRFIPNRPDSVLLIMMNSHNFAGVMNRGVFVRRVPITHTFYGFNGLNPTPARWNEYGLPMKYYYDGTEEVPDGASGGTNEVRGYSAYDWTQTIAFDKSGKSLKTIGDGTNGKHCGLGVHCDNQENKKTPYIYRPVLQSSFTNLTSRRVLITYEKVVTCDDTPVKVTREEAIKQLETADGTSFYVDRGENTVDLYINIISAKIADTDEQGSSVFSVNVRNNDNEIFHDRNYKFLTSIGKTLPLCTSWLKSIMDLSPNYTSIGSATVCKGGKTSKTNNEKICSEQCSKDPNCTYFSYNYVSKICSLGCTPSPFKFTEQVCDTIAYKKATDLDVDKISTSVVGEGVVELKNRFCKSGQQLFQDIYDTTLEECSNMCTEEKNCKFFTHNGNRCSMYSDCNFGIRDPYEYDFADLGMDVPIKGNETKMYANLNFINKFEGQDPVTGPIDIIHEDPETQPSNKLSAIGITIIVVIVIMLLMGVSILIFYFMNKRKLKK